MRIERFAGIISALYPNLTATQTGLLQAKTSAVIERADIYIW
jgi:hypothetical protein